ncbi:hypothetical protein OROGR_009163 [Orobanche gracilis]
MYTSCGDLVQRACKEIGVWNGILISRTRAANHPDIDRLARGVGPISLVGEYDGDKKMEDLKLLYSVYASSSRRTKDNKRF